jgi:YidC/Oxa1 family membrane protein insertase
MTIPFANIFQPLIDIFDGVLVFFHDSIGLSWGMSIIALTVCVRAVLVPLTLKQFKSMQGLQRLAPEMKALQEKYRDDKQRLQEETMKLYREHKVNPFSSCLPLIMQLPVFLSLFYMLRKDLKIDICGPEEKIAAVAAQLDKPITQVGCNQVDPGSASFLFINDLTARATGGVLIVLLVLYVGSQLLSSVLMSVTADRNQRMIMMALPFVFVPFIQSFPAGLIVYWITTNLWTVGQQYIIRRTAGLPVRGAPIPSLAGAASRLTSGDRKDDQAKDDRAKDDRVKAAGRKDDRTKDDRVKTAGKDDRKAPAQADASKGEARGRRKRGAVSADGASGSDATTRPAKPRSAPPPPPRRRKKKTGRRR